MMISARASKTIKVTCSGDPRLILYFFIFRTSLSLVVELAACSAVVSGSFPRYGTEPDEARCLPLVVPEGALAAEAFLVCFLDFVLDYGQPLTLKILDPWLSFDFLQGRV